jgi:hypothetical protein
LIPKKLNIVKIAKEFGDLELLKKNSKNYKEDLIETINIQIFKGNYEFLKEFYYGYGRYPESLVDYVRHIYPIALERATTIALNSYNIHMLNKIYTDTKSDYRYISN